MEPCAHCTQTDRKTNRQTEKQPHKKKQIGRAIKGGKDKESCKKKFIPQWPASKGGGVSKDRIRKNNFFETLKLKKLKRIWRYRCIFAKSQFKKIYCKS